MRAPLLLATNDVFADQRRPARDGDTPLDGPAPTAIVAWRSGRRADGTEAMQGEADSTRTLARIVGPTLIAGGLAVLVRRGELPAILESFAQDAAIGFLVGVVGLVAGLCLLAFHSRVSSLAAFTLTLLGWLMVARGLGLLFAPSWVMVAAHWFVETPHAFDITGVVVALFGAWLSTVGFSARPPALAS